MAARRVGRFAGRGNFKECPAIRARVRARVGCRRGFFARRKSRGIHWRRWPKRLCALLRFCGATQFVHSMKSYLHVNYLWDDAKAAALDPVGRLVYRSNLLGSDQRITNTGGGNTSSKIAEPDPISGKAEKVMWV